MARKSKKKTETKETTP